MTDAFRREQVIGYRIAAQQLDRSAGAIGKLAVLDLGVQDSGAEAARLAFDARLAATPPADGIGPGHRLALVWSHRGAPHVHRRRDLDALAGVLWPLSDDDATYRLDASKSMSKAGLPALEGWESAVAALRKSVRTPTAKGAASAAVTELVPESVTRHCRACGATHVFELPFRIGAVPAGLELEPGTSPPVLVPRFGAAAVTGPDVAAVRAAIRSYLTLLGPASQADVADFLGARRADIAQLWPEDLVEVSVEGRRGWLPRRRLAALRAAEPAEVVRLLGPFDPYLQARDRALIVPDKSVYKTLWPVLGRPGVVLADGEVVGTWRPKGSKKRLDLTVQEFVPWPPSLRRAVETEAERVAAVRGAPDVRLVS